VTYHVVVAFDRDEEGDLKPGEAQEVMSPIVAERRARALALEHAGALAFSRTGNPATGEFQDAVILAFIVSGAAKQRSSRCAAALIIKSCASVSLALMVRPFLSSRSLGRSEPLTRTSPGSAEAEGAVGSHAHHAHRV